MLDVFVEDLKEFSLHGIVAAVDRGYGSLKLLERIMEHGMGEVIVMPQHGLPFHPFVAHSNFKISQQDEEMMGYYTLGEAAQN